MELTITQINEQKQKLQQDISALINEFSKATSLKVDKVELSSFANKGTPIYSVTVSASLR